MADESLPENFLLIDSLKLHPHSDVVGGTIEDTVANRFFRLGPRELMFVHSLLATRSAELAWQQGQDGSEPSLSRDDAERMCRWLIANKLIHSAVDSAPAPSAPRSMLAKAFFLKIPLVDPDAWLEQAVRYGGWLFGVRSALLCLSLFLIGMLAVAGRWSDFLYSYENLFSPWRGLSLLLAWCGLKVIHEAAHAGTCKRYGGEVKEAGLAFILLMPLAYVNVTTSWRFPSRWHRLHVTLAGVVAELCVAGLALVLFSCTSSPVLQQIAADVFLLASVNSLLFNLNPMLRFDGYFAVADATGVDNLYGHGQQYARYFGGRYLLGLDMQIPRLPAAHAGWIKLYGCAAAVYRTTTVAGLLVAAAALLEGAGVVIAAGGAIAFVGKPLAMLCKHLAASYVAGRLSIPRFVIRISALYTIVIAPLWWIPAGLCWTVPAIVQYDPPAVLRARSDGFVDHIHVSDGQLVTKGQPVVTLRNDDLVIELERARTELSQTHRKLLTAQWLGQSSESKAAKSRSDALAEQVEQLQADVDHLTILAPVDGQVVSRKLSNLIGTFVKGGTEIAVIGREESKRLKVSIAQSDASYLETCATPQTRVIVGNSVWNATIDRLETRADSKPIDDSLLAINGGSQASIQDDNANSHLVTPRVSGFIRLTPAQSLSLRPGRRASVALAGKHQTLGDQLLSNLQALLAL